MELCHHVFQRLVYTIVLLPCQIEAVSMELVHGCQFGAVTQESARCGLALHNDILIVVIIVFTLY
jgi:hypothetical protein